METYDSDDDPDYHPETCCSSESEHTDDTVEFSCPECLHLELAKDKLINQLSKYMTLYKKANKKIKELEKKLNK